MLIAYGRPSPISLQSHRRLPTNARDEDDYSHSELRLYERSDRCERRE